MALTEAKRKANNKWDSANMTVLGCKVRKDYAEEVKARAKEQGTTVNAIFTQALKDFMGRGCRGRTMSEASRVILGLRAAGWSEKDINDFILWVETGEEQYKPKVKA